jgi:hypothetical protein
MRVELSSIDHLMHPAAASLPVASSRSFDQNVTAFEITMHVYHENGKIVMKHKSERPINGDIDECEVICTLFETQQNTIRRPDFLKKFKTKRYRIRDYKANLSREQENVQEIRI